MKSAAKIALLILLTLALAILVVLRFLDLGRFRDQITGPLTELTGREVRIDGAIRFEPGLSLRLAAEDVSFGNADWGTRPQMATATRVAGALKLLPLLRGQIQIAGIVIEGADVLLERNTEGAGNWELERNESDKAEKGKDPKSLPWIGSLEVRNARLAYLRAAADRPVVLNLERLLLRSPAADSPVEIDLEAEFEGTRAMVDARTSPITKWKFGDPWPTLDGTLELSAAEPARSAAALGVDLPALPVTTVSARVSKADQMLSVSAIDVRIGDNDLTGEASLAWAGERPRVTGVLRSERLYLEELFPDSGGKAKGERKNAAPASDALPWGYLETADADVSVAVKSFHLRTGGAIDDILLEAVLNDGKLDATGRAGAVGKGNAEATLQADAATTTVDLDFRAGNVAIESLVSGDTIRNATLNARVRLSGHGTSREALVRSLEGSKLVEVGSGTFSGGFVDLIARDLVGQVIDQINPAVRKSGPTRLECIVMNARIRSGIVEFDKGIGFETANVKVIGAGTLDLATDKIDFAVRTDPQGGAGVSVATVVDSLIRIRGTYAKPEIQVDALGTARAAVNVGGAVMTGGLSLLGGGLLGKSASDISPCLIARGMAPEEKSTTDTIADTAETVGDTVRKGVGAAGRGLGKALGR